MRGGTFYLTSNEVYWLAGLLEAEGSFVTGAPTEPRTPVLLTNMTDFDVIEAVARKCGSTVINSHPAFGNRKAMYRTSLRGGSAVSLMKLLHPLIGNRRQQQMERAIACHNPKTPYPHREYVLTQATVPEHDRQWLADYLEGEGSFSLHTETRGTKTYAYPLLQVNTTDQDIIQRVRVLWEAYTEATITIGMYQPKYKGSKINYHIGIKGTRAQLLMEYVYPLLFARRQHQIRSILAGSNKIIGEDVEGAIYAV